MRFRHFFLIAVTISAVSCGLVQGDAAIAQDPFADLDKEPIDRLSFTEKDTPSVARSSSDIRTSRMSVAELRQKRALYRANQRMARLENNLWMGYEPLRPKWNSIPMMSSRYTTRRLYTPVYVFPR